MGLSLKNPVPMGEDEPEVGGYLGWNQRVALTTAEVGWRRGASDGGHRGGEGVEDAGGGDAEGEDAADQQHAQRASGPVEADGRAVAGIAEDGFADDAEVVIDGDGGIDDGDDDEEEVAFVQGGGEQA